MTFTDYTGRLFISALLITLATFYTVYAMPIVVWVKIDKTPLLESPFYRAKVIEKLAFGDELTVKNEVGKYYLVTTKKGKSGYVERLRATDVKPEEKQDGGSASDLFGALTGMTRSAKVKESSGSHSVRGLKAGGAAGGGATAKEASHSLKIMEINGVTKANLDAFASVGKVGRYAR